MTSATGMPSLSPNPPGSRASEAARQMAQALEDIGGGGEDDGASPAGGSLEDTDG